MAPYGIDLAGDRLKGKLQAARDGREEGSSCFVRADGDPNNSKPFVAKIQALKPDPDNGGLEVTVRWYYRPEDPGIPGGRKAFHGERELYMSDHQDVIHSATILGRCNVHSISAYHDLEIIRPQDYFSRFQFSVKTKKFYPESVTVYCSCQLPENPDRPMSKCDACQEWFHPECCHTTVEAIEQADVWRCPTCERKHAQRQQQPQTQHAVQQQAAQQQHQVLQPQPVFGGMGGPMGASRTAQHARIAAAAAGAVGMQPAAPPGSMMPVDLGPGGNQVLLPDPLLEALQAQLAQQQQQQQQPQYSLGGWGSPAGW